MGKLTFLRDNQFMVTDPQYYPGLQPCLRFGLSPPERELAKMSTRTQRTRSTRLPVFATKCRHAPRQFEPACARCMRSQLIRALARRLLSFEERGGAAHESVQLVAAPPSRRQRGRFWDIPS